MNTRSLVLQVFFSLSLSVFSLSVLASSAHAGSREVRERAAKKACLTGDAAKGVDILADLYLDSGDVNYLFNQGRCFEQNHRYRDAISRFREYLTKGTHLQEDERADAEKHIAACQAYLGSDAVAAPPAPVSEKPEPASEAPATRQPAPPMEQPPAAVVHEAKPSASPRPGSGLRTTGLVLVAVGGVSLVAAVILNLKANSMSSDLEDLYSSKTDSTRRTYKTLGWVGYGVGAASLATGVALYYVGWSRGRAASASWALLPMASPNTAGAVLSGAF